MEINFQNPFHRIVLKPSPLHVFGEYLLSLLLPAQMCVCGSKEPPRCVCFMFGGEFLKGNRIVFVLSQTKLGQPQGVQIPGIIGLETDRLIDEI